MAGNLYAWSQTAASNSNSDATINWAEGQLPGTVNDSARAMMAVEAAFLADNNATGTTAGTGAAYTFTSALTEASLATGIKLRLKMNATNTGACTLALTPAGGSVFATKAIRVIVGGGEQDPSAGMIQNNGIYDFNYDAAANSAAGAFMLLNPTIGAGTFSRTLPGGRLTLTTVTPVLKTNTTAQGTVYYTPYIHDLVPIYDGTGWTLRNFAELSVVLDTTNVLSGNLYDFFVINNSGTVALGYGPAWTNNTTRSGAISRLNGIWTNTASMTIRLSSSTTVSAGANTAIHVGTIRATANGQTGMNFNPAPAAGGGANVLGVFNTYNRVLTIAVSQDNTSSWSYNSATWRAANGNANNSISFIDGLGEMSTAASYVIAATNTSVGAVGINFNSTSATPTFQTFGPATVTGSFTCAGVFLPALGYNTVTAMEASNNATTYYGSGAGAPTTQTQALETTVTM